LSAAVAVPTKQRSRQPPVSKPWKSGGRNNGGTADPEIVIVTAPPPAASQRVTRPVSGRVTSSNGAQRSTAGMTPAADSGLPAGLAATASAALPRAGRKSVAGVPMRVPGGPLLAAESSSSDAGQPALVAAAGTRGRRTSMMPQRVPYSSHEAPAQARAAATAVGYGPGRAALGGAAFSGPDVVSHHMVPDSPDSFAHSDTSGVGDGAAVGLDYRGVPTR